MGSALLAVAPCFVASTLACLNVRPPMAALKTLPVRFLRSLHYRRSGLHWVQPRHMSSSSLSLAVQLRVLLAMEPRKVVRRPAKLVYRNPTARSSRLRSLASSSRIGGAVRGTTPSVPREQICGCSFFPVRRGNHAEGAVGGRSRASRRAPPRTEGNTATRVPERVGTRTGRSPAMRASVGPPTDLPTSGPGEEKQGRERPDAHALHNAAREQGTIRRCALPVGVTSARRAWRADDHPDGKR